MKSYQINYILFTIFSLCLLTSCDGLVNEVDPKKLPKIESKLVVESYISPQSKTIQVVVTESQPLFGASSYAAKIIKNAKVTLSGSSGQTMIPFNDSLGLYKLPASQYKIEAGKTYQLTVSDSYRSVTAKCTVPAESAPMKKYIFEIIEGDPSPWDSTSNDRLVKVRFYLDDIPGIKNQYTFHGYLLMQENQTKYNTPGPTGIHRVEYKKNFYLPTIVDNNADGQTLNSGILESFSRNYTSYYQETGGKKVYFKSDPVVKEIYLEILNMDENYYKFQQTMGKNNEDIPFIEPTLTYTNIEGGLGCFGAYNASATTIKMN